MLMSYGPLRTAVALMLAIVGVAHAQGPPLPDSREFLADSLRSIRSNNLLHSRYTCTEKEVRYTYDSSGRVMKTQRRVCEVDPSLEPELTYRRLVSVNGVEPVDLAARDTEHRRKAQERTAGSPILPWDLRIGDTRAELSRTLV